jgi:hypothetical protein
VTSKIKIEVLSCSGHCTMRSGLIVSTFIRGWDYCYAADPPSMTVVATNVN